MPQVNPLVVRPANLDDLSDQRAVLDLLDMYSREEMGCAAPLSDDVRERLIPGLQQQSGCRIFLAVHEDRPIGIAVCFMGFSSFRAKPLINVHDLAVVPEARGKGVGRALLAAVEDAARKTGCCRVTLEVRADNHRAKGLYQSYGFEAGQSDSDTFLFWKKNVESE